MKPQDPQAERITFGIELETTIPALSGVTIGGYHQTPFLLARFGPSGHSASRMKKRIPSI
jgi:hypothetical protein